MFLVTVLGCFAAQASEIDLAGDWQLTDGERSLCAVVPGGVHDALLKAHMIDDVYWGTNETNALWVGKREWTFSREFHVDDKVMSHREIVLRMEDCDTFATVSINGQSVGRTSDRFQRYTFDAKPFLKTGDNEITVCFDSPERVADERCEQIGRPFPMSNVLWAKNQALIRKPACHAGWDWGPSVQTIGLCGTVKLIASDSPRIDYVYTAQQFNEDLSHCTLDVFADLSDGTTVTNRIEIDNPPLWWPNGAGEQNFYTFTVDVNGEVVTKRIGLRKLEILNEKDETGLSLVVRVNNRRLFMKGANWIPCDAYEGRQTPERYRNLLESAAAANMNMIRVWGGGQYEKDCFYDICDELGILIWHDMMHSCAVYPGENWFLDEVRGELAHQLRRLRDHASIVLWCGDNECLGAIKWFDETRFDEAYYRKAWMIRSQMQGDFVARYDPLRTYWPSSPCCGPGDFGNAWKDDSKGDMHNWDVWHENAPFAKYYEYRPRFCSEFGYQSFPSMETAETFATTDEICSHAPAFEWHQKNPGGNRRIRETMLRYFKPPRDVPSELLLSQFQQAMGIKMAVDGWRAQRPRCMGTLYWQLNDNWPVASWSSIEYGGKWKPLHYVAKRFFANVSVVAAPDVSSGSPDVTRGRVFAINDTPKVMEGKLTLEYWSYSGEIVSAETFDLVLAPDSSTDVAGFEKPSLPGNSDVFLYLTLETDEGIVRNEWHFDFYKNLPLEDAKIRADISLDGGETCLLLSTDKPAFFTWLNVKGRRGEFDDNCLTLLPGRPARIRWKGDGELKPDDFTVTQLKECTTE